MSPHLHTEVSGQGHNNHSNKQKTPGTVYYHEKLSGNIAITIHANF